MRIVVNSCLPDDEVRRLKRWRALQQQRTWFNQWGFSPEYICVGWRPQEEKTFGGIIHSYQSLPFSDARNLQIEILHSTAEPWGVMADDDAIITDSDGSLGRLLTILRKGELSNVHMFTPNIPSAPRIGMNSSWLADPQSQTHWLFQRYNAFKGSWIFLRNLKSEHGIELRCPDLPFGEDTALMFKVAEMGFNPMWLKNIDLKELGPQGCWIKEGMARNDWKPKVAEMFDHLFIGQGKLQTARFFRQHSTAYTIKIAKEHHVSELFDFTPRK